MTYDAAGNCLTERVQLPAVGKAPDGSKSLSYTYDIYDQLTGETSSGKGHYRDAYGFTFGYDLAGNATSFPGQSSPGYNGDNQLSGPSYNGNGDPSSAAGGQGASWDAEDRLTGIGSASFSYDPDGLRASKTAGLSTTFFLYDGETPVLEEDAAGQVTAANGMAADGWRQRYYPGAYPGGPSGNTWGHQYYSYTFDPQGNLVQRQRQSNNGAGALDTVAYDAFGKRLGDTDALTGAAETYADPVGFGGQFGYYGDPETGLSLLTHRYYDSGTGRFVSRDPTGYAGGLNLYGYAGNNPVNNSDAKGLQSDGSPDDWVGLPKDDSGRQFYYDGLRKAVHTGAGIALAGTGMVADSLPGMNYIEGVYGEDALGHRLGAGTRLLLLAPALGAVLHRIGPAIGWLRDNENLFSDAHVFKLHVNKSNWSLAWRLMTNRTIPAATTFTDEATAEAVVGETLAAYQPDIAVWVHNGMKGTLGLKYVGKDVIGRGIFRGEIHFRDLTDATVVLKKDRATGRWFILTAYPDRLK